MLILSLSGACARKEPPLLTPRKNVKDCISQNKMFGGRIIYHIVQPGDTLYKISKLYNVQLGELIKLNEIKDPSHIFVGQTLKIPRYETPQFIWPVKARISSSFGKRGRNGFHSGIDIPAPKGTPIKAAADGMVVKSGKSLDGYAKYGKIIIIEHTNGVRTLYAHNSVNFVKAGECVRAGDIIGEVGSSGNASGPHLHFEIRKNGRPLNPLKYLP